MSWTKRVLRCWWTMRHCGRSISHLVDQPSHSGTALTRRAGPWIINDLVSSKARISIFKMPPKRRCLNLGSGFLLTASNLLLLYIAYSSPILRGTHPIYPPSLLLTEFFLCSFLLFASLISSYIGLPTYKLCQAAIHNFLYSIMLAHCWWF